MMKRYENEQRMIKGETGGGEMMNDRKGQRTIIKDKSKDKHNLINQKVIVRGHPQLYVPLYIPYLIFIFHLHFALLTYLFVTVWLPP